MLIGLQKAVINSEPQNAVKSRKKKNQVRNDGSNVRENGVISVNTETDLKLNHDVVKFQVEMLPNALKELLEVNDVSNEAVK